MSITTSDRINICFIGASISIEATPNKLPSDFTLNINYTEFDSTIVMSVNSGNMNKLKEYISHKHDRVCSKILLANELLQKTNDQDQYREFKYFIKYHYETLSNIVLGMYTNKWFARIDKIILEKEIVRFFGLNIENNEDDMNTVDNILCAVGFQNKAVLELEQFLNAPDSMDVLNELIKKYKNNSLAVYQLINNIEDYNCLKALI